MSLCPYWNPTKRIFREGAFDLLPQILSSYQVKRVLVTLGKHSFKSSPYYERLHHFLSKLQSVELSGDPNPSVCSIESSILKAKDFQPDIILAIGGGSVLDLAKILSFALPQTVSFSSLIKDSLADAQNALPLIAVPTTAGTGSEVTPYASFDFDKQKLSLSKAALFPAYALVDPELTYSMPPYETACTGFDALSQAIESYWSIAHNDYSDTHALRSLHLINKCLRDAVSHPTPFARKCMALASSEAGLAIAQTRTTAVHSVSYPITTHFGIPHGHACALTLSSFIRYNADAIDAQRAKFLWSALGAHSADQAARWVEDTMASVGLERSFSKLGLSQSDLDIIIGNGFRPDRVKNNPKQLSQFDLKEMLLKLL